MEGKALIDLLDVRPDNTELIVRHDEGKQLPFLVYFQLYVTNEENDKMEVIKTFFLESFKTLEEAVAYCRPMADDDHKVELSDSSIAKIKERIAGDK